jgi:hypothetical protein
MSIFEMYSNGGAYNIPLDINQEDRRTAPLGVCCNNLFNLSSIFILTVQI